MYSVFLQKSEIFGTKQRFIMIRLCADAKRDPNALTTGLTHEMQYDFG